MVTLVVSGWDELKRWVGPNAWSRSALAESLEHCVDLLATDVNRMARTLLRREKMQIPVRSKETAASAFHILELQGAIVSFIE
jgi:hypothetical protein